MSRIRVLLADDHTVARTGVRSILEQANLEIVAEANDGKQALDLAIQHKPDVAVLDYNMPEMNGAQVCERLQRETPTVHVVILSAHEDRAFLKQVLEKGARGYVLKRGAIEDLLQAIHAVVAGGLYIDPALAGHVVAGYVGSEPIGVAAQVLSTREEEVLRLIARGYVNKEVAAMLDVSIKTVETHKLRAMEKLGLDSRVDLTRYAYQQGWFDES